MFISEDTDIDELCENWEFDEDSNSYHVNFPDDTYICINRTTREVTHEGWSFIDHIVSK